MLCGSFLSLLGIIGIVYAAQWNHSTTEATTLPQPVVPISRKMDRIAMWIAIGWVLLFVIAMILIFGIIGWAGFLK